MSDDYKTFGDTVYVKQGLEKYIHDVKVYQLKKELEEAKKVEHLRIADWIEGNPFSKREIIQQLRAQETDDDK